MMNAGGASPYTRSSECFIVDSGCSSHVVVDDSYFIAHDPDFVPALHTVELADGKVLKSKAEKRGTVQLFFKDVSNQLHEVTLHNVLHIPTFPTNLFSVKAATKKQIQCMLLP
jgi:hypothetical protein